LIEAGKIAPLLDPHSFTLESAEAAHVLLLSGAAKGRLVVEV
jgi:NADPH:quinone reductase-like Zn-dependent oxidoreductase